MVQKTHFLGAVILSAVCIVIYTKVLHHSARSFSSRFTGFSEILRSEWASSREQLPKTQDEEIDDTVVLQTGTERVRFPKDLKYMVHSVPFDVVASAQKKLIVIFNRPEWLFALDLHYVHVFDTCPYKCNMTDDRTLIPQADAVWVDVGRLGDPHPPSNLRLGQVCVAHNSESPVHYEGHHNSPAWKSVFNWTFSYRTDADIFRPYGEFELRAEPAVKNYTQIMLNKTKPIAWFVSNCHTSSKRNEYVKELSKHIAVDIYGSCGTLRCQSNEICLGMLNTTYYFYLSFENSFCQDYVTEKLFKTYKNLNLIPIVRGGFNYSQYLPPNTYLDTGNFSSPKHLAQYLHGLMKDVHTYTGMLRTKDHFYASFSSLWWPNLKPFCQLCRRLQITPSPHKVYPDIMEWSGKDRCWEPQDV